MQKIRVIIEERKKEKKELLYCLTYRIQVGERVTIKFMSNKKQGEQINIHIYMVKRTTM